MDKSPANVSYRSLELLCRRQAKLSATPGAQDELERMPLEYEQMADWQERQGGQTTPPHEHARKAPPR